MVEGDRIGDALKGLLNVFIMFVKGSERVDI
jgi:hypothetical protein